MTLRDEINAVYKTVNLEVRAAGTLVTDVFEVVTSAGLSQVNAEAKLLCRARPDWCEELTPIEVRAGYNNVMGLVFLGEIAGVAWEYAPTVIGLPARDYLGRTRDDWGGADLTYSSETDDAIISDILIQSGIPAWMLDIVGSDWTLGTIDPVVVSGSTSGAYTSGWRLIEEIDRLSGYRTFTGTDGRIHRRRVSGSPAPGAAWTYTQGVNILSLKRTRNLSGIRNRCVVSGLAYEGVEITGEASAPNSYIPSSPGYITEPLQSNLVETDEIAAAIAQTYVADHNRRPEGLVLGLVGNPLLQPGMTIQVDSDEIEADEALALIERVQHTINSTGFVSDVQTTAGTLSGYDASAPVAQFDLKLFLEGEDTGSGIDAVIVGVADATGSFDPGGPETGLTFAWALSGTGATPNPTSGSEVIQRFTLDGAATAVTVALTVTNPDGLSNVFEVTQTIDTSTMLVEDLYTAEGTVVACSSDGQQTWNEQTPASGSATCLMPLAPSWGQIWGTSTGHIYATFDKCVSALVDLGQPHGAVACTAVWVHELVYTRLWAGFSDGKVYYGEVDLVAQTAAWVLAGTVPDSPITELRESYGALGELRATAGSAEYYSPDAGGGWSSGPTSAGDATRMAAGFDTNAVAFDGDASPIKYEDGSPPTFPVLVPVVDSISALTFGWRVKELVAVDDQNPARVFRTDDDTLLTFAQVSSLGHQGNHIIRSGNEDGVIYAAVGDGATGVNGVQKSTDRGDSWFYARRTGTRKCSMVGYGDTHTPVQTVTVEFVVPTFFGAGANDGVWHYVPGVGHTLKNSGLPTSWFWYSIFVDPFDQSHWFLMGNSTDHRDYFTISGGQLRDGTGATSPFWQTHDDGGTWTAVNVTVPDWVIFAINPQIAFDRVTAGQMIVAIIGQGAGLGVSSLLIARGTSSPLASVGTNDKINGIFAMSAGLNGDVVVNAVHDDYSVVVGYVASGSSTCILSATGVYQVANMDITRNPTLMRGIVAVGLASLLPLATEHFFATKDYRTIPWTSRISGWYNEYVASVADGTLYIGSNSDPTNRQMRKMTDPLGSPSVTYVSTQLVVTESYSFVAAGQRLNVAVMARVAAGGGRQLNTFVFDGATWTEVTGPAAAVAGHLADCGAVIERGSS